MKRFLWICLLTITIQTLFSQTAYPGYQDGKIYVRLTTSGLKTILSENPGNISLNKFSEFSKLFSKYGVTKVTRPFHQASDDENLSAVIQVYFTNYNKASLFIDELSRSRQVVYAEKIPTIKTDAVPNDPLYSSCPHLTQINAPNAWNVFNGSSNITVAVVDNAIMWNHADLAGNVYTNTAEAGGTTGVDDDGNGYIDDINGWDAADNDNSPLPPNTNIFHGTHVAGIAGARTDNSVGVSSIGWNIKIIPVKGEPSASGSNFSVTNGYEGILYSVKAGARIISCSWGGANYAITQQYVIDYAWNRGSIIIASAGNNNNNSFNYPGAYNNVYCVAAVTGSDVKWSLSSYGSWVDISAPGENILSTMPYVGTPTYQPQSGTSMATPMVAGLAALMLSKSPNMTRTDVLNCISNTAVNIYTLAGNSSYSGSLGAGRIDAFAAMNCAATFSALPPVSNFYAFPLNTCPNTAVNFYDSSLYVPTSWSWVFQGGSPATSTLANPTVSWSTAGTYSVSLTVTNANGTNAKTKLSYITVAGPQSLPLVEGFQGTQFLPANWTPKNIWNDNLYWARVTGIGGYGTSTACAVFNNYDMNVPGERDEMRTPKYSFSNVASAQLKFDVAYARYNAFYSDSLEVRLSTNCGSTWTTIYAKGGSTLATAPDNTTSMFVPTNTQWRTEITDISTLTAGQGNVMFSFINRGHYGQPIYVDNINLSFPTPTVNISVASSVCVGSPVTYTNNTIGAGGYSWSFPGTSQGVSTLTTPAVTYTAPGTYTAMVTAINGTVTSVATRTINVFSIPVLSVNSASICSGATATLTGSGATTYSWTNGPQAAANIVTPSVTTVYTLTGVNGGVCASGITATVQVTPTPTVSVNANPATICDTGSSTLTASGATSFLWNTGAGTSTIVVTPVSTTVYTVTGMNGTCTSATTINLTVSTTPTVSINSTAPGTICSGSSATLTASGANTYSWSNGALSSSIIITPTALTAYTVTGSNSGCTNSQVYVIAVAAPVNVTLSTSSQSLCAGQNVTLSATGASSYVWSTGAPGSSVVVSPSVTSVFTVTGSDSQCSGNASITITVRELPSSLYNVKNSSCDSTCKGGISVVTTGGSSPYSYSLTGSNCTTPPCLNLCDGQYTIYTTDAMGCKTSAVFTIQCGVTAISENEAGDDATIFPNPADAEIKITCKGLFTYSVYNNLGQLITEKNLADNVAVYNVSNLAEGIYTVKVDAGNNTYIQKVVIVRQ
jgi:serine protease